MIFFAILLALLIEQAQPLSVDNPVFAGLRNWARLVRRNLDTGQLMHGWVAWVLATAAPALLTALLYWALWRFSTVLSFVWLVLVLYVTLGFRQFSHHFTDIRQALEEGNDAQAREKLAQWLHVETSSLPRAELLRQVIEQSVLAAHRHVFGVLACFVVFWLLGLGPAGAVFYRMAEYVSRNWRARPDGSRSAAIERAGSQGWNWVDHLPARATALGFAVVGNFEEAVASWRGESERFAPGSDGVVLAATSGAINVRLHARDELAEDALSARPEPQLAHLASAVGLVWRSVVLWMLLLALLTLAHLLA
jgi:adenosylcobinamide-phosphate synthase